MANHQTKQWREIQDRLASSRVESAIDPLPRFIAGADCAFSSDGQTIFAVALVWDRETEQVVDKVEHSEPVAVPYIPGYLSFREGPALIEAIGRLKSEYGVILFDGQGIAHPRRCGIATHVGVMIDRPSVGVAKSLLFGKTQMPRPERGAERRIVDNSDTLGLCVRTRDNVRPIYLSVGHRVDLASARKLLLACLRGRRLPEPTRLADKIVADFKRKSA